MKYSLAETFELLTSSVNNISAQALVDQCLKLGMKEVDNIDLGFDSMLPQFDNSFVFIFSTDDEEKARLEILDKEGKILQAGIQIFYKPAIFFSNFKKHYRKTIELLEKHYGPASPIDLGNNMEIINFGDLKTVAYTSKMKLNGSDILTLKVGNTEFWSKD
jgi:hypothetical protein